MSSIDSVMRQKSLYLDCHSGLDPESSISELDSRFRGNDETSGILYTASHS